MAVNDRSPPSRTPNQSGRPDQVETIPLVEERLTVDKRTVETGRVRVKVSVDERVETVTERLFRDDVEVERVPRNVRLTDMPRVRVEGDTTVIPVVEEVMVVEKALVLVEEIYVHRLSGTQTVEVPVTLRSEHAEVERSGAPPAAAFDRADPGDRDPRHEAGRGGRARREPIDPRDRNF